MDQIRRAASIIYLERVRRELARRKFMAFCRWMRPDWDWVDHHSLIADLLDLLRRGDVTRLDVNMPPRHSKSEMCSILYPAWWLGHNPDKQIIHVSHSASLTNEFSRKVRGMIRDDERYKMLFPGVALDSERARIDDWKTTEGGGFKSVGVQGGITGHGADLLIIDDPVKEGDEQSVTALNAIFDWYLSAARTRLSPGAAVLLVMTRWSPLDLAGRLLDLADKDLDADQWISLVLPALAEANDPLGRELGAALWPDRYSEVELRAIQRLSERYFAALFQQRPTVSEQPMFRKEDFRRFPGLRYRPAESDSERVWAVDLAASEKTRADYTVFVRGHRRGSKLRVLEVRRFRAEWPEAKKALKNLILEFPEDRFALPKHNLELLALQELWREIPDMMHRVEQVDLPGDKVERAQVASDVCRAGLLEVVVGDEGDYFVDEHVLFPDGGQHDDCVDASSILTHYFGFKQVFDAVFSVGKVPERFEDLVGEVLAAVGGF